MNACFISRKIEASVRGKAVFIYKNSHVNLNARSKGIKNDTKFIEKIIRHDITALINADLNCLLIILRFVNLSILEPRNEIVGLESGHQNVE